MSNSKIAFVALPLAAALALFLAAPAGTATGPSLIRQASIGGISGPAYYSVVEGGYRRIRPPASDVAAARTPDEAGGEQVADITESDTVSTR